MRAVERERGAPVIPAGSSYAFDGFLFSAEPATARRGLLPLAVAATGYLGIHWVRKVAAVPFAST